MSTYSSALPADHSDLPIVCRTACVWRENGRVPASVTTGAPIHSASQEVEPAAEWKRIERNIHFAILLQHGGVLAESIECDALAFDAELGKVGAQLGLQDAIRHALFVPGGIALTSTYASRLLADDVLHPAIAPSALFVVIVAVVALIAYLGIGTSASVDLLLVAGEMAVIAALAITSWSRPGPRTTHSPCSPRPPPRTANSPTSPTR